MFVQKFVFRKNWIGSKVVAGMKNFLGFLTQFGPTFWPPKDPNNKFFKQSFSFQLIRKTEVILLSVL